MKFILSVMLIIASIFMAQSTFAMDAQVQEALTPPDTFLTVSAFLAPVEQSKVIYETSLTVILLSNKSDHFNIYILNKSNESSNEKTLMPVANIMEVETVPKFPHLIQPNSIQNEILNSRVAI